jgi:membrane protein YdbS with pleckstrin-like domain
MTPDMGIFDDDPTSPIGQTVRGAMRRIVATVLTAVLWLSVTLVYLAFWVHGWTLAEYVVAGTVSFLGLIGALVLIWVTFGIRLYHVWVEG